MSHQHSSGQGDRYDAYHPSDRSSRDFQSSDSYRSSSHHGYGHSPRDYYDNRGTPTRDHGHYRRHTYRDRDDPGDHFSRRRHSDRSTSHSSRSSRSRSPRSDRPSSLRNEPRSQDYSQEPTNTGENDVAKDDSEPIPFLIVRQLAPHASEQVLATGMAKLYKKIDLNTPSAQPAQPSPSTLKSASSSANSGPQEGSIKRVLLVRDKRSNASWGYGFVEFHSTAAAREALLKFNSTPKMTISSQPIDLKYTHTGVFKPADESTPTGHTFLTGDPVRPFVYRDERAYVRELVVNESPPGPTEPRKSAKSQASLQEQQGLVIPLEEGLVKTKKRKADGEAVGKKDKIRLKMFETWENASSKRETSEEKHAMPSTETTDEAAALSQSFIDRTNMCCRLCNTRFKKLETIDKHVQQSKLHLKNLEDEALVAKVVNAMKEKEKARASTLPAGYRDRAKERRKSEDDQSEGPTPEPEAPVKQSIGANLLGKMGYVEGKGLGADGQGRIAPIQTNMYTPGVGLGAANSMVGDAAQEGSRRTQGGSNDLKEKTMESARQRFNHP